LAVEQRQDGRAISQRSECRLTDDHRVYANFRILKQRDEAGLGAVEIVTQIEVSTRIMR
jgi:hypothetical protein